MKTIQTTITVRADGSIHVPPQPILQPGEHQAVLVVQENVNSASGKHNEREQAIDALAAAGLLATLAPDEQSMAARSTLSLEEARAILDRAGGKPLSEIIDEMRGPKP